jgi:SAM-dependent methyltransferase
MPAGDCWPWPSVRAHPELHPVSVYTDRFYETHRRGSRRSAEEIMPIVIELVRPRAVVDVGCGLGSWLAVCAERGLRIFGVDGPHVSLDLLEIPRDCFAHANIAEPFDLGAEFDLVLCLEVAEHLPPEAAPMLVESLARLGPVVLFSAAIPFQGGTAHVNEQWPEYWAALFEAHGYLPVDCLRRRIWRNPRIEWWYAQNALLFVRRDHLDAVQRLRDEAACAPRELLPLVHPRNLERLEDELEWMRNWRGVLCDVTAHVPSEAVLILIDDDQLQLREVLGSLRCLAFLEQDGQYWGPPPDDATAIGVLRRLVDRGARFVVFAWPAFWWLEHYRGFHEHLQATARCVLANSRSLIFECVPSPDAKCGIVTVEATEPE